MKCPPFHQLSESGFTGLKNEQDVTQSAVRRACLQGLCVRKDWRTLSESGFAGLKDEQDFTQPAVRRACLQGLPGDSRNPCRLL